MAKKINPADMTVEEKLQKLYQLQTLLSEIDRYRALRGELPLEVQDLEDEIAGLEHRIAKNEEDVRELEADMAKRKNKIAEASERLATYHKQLDEVRNNREYDMLQHEIEFQDLEVQLQNKKMGDAQARIAELREGMKQTAAQLDERRADLDAKKAELDEIVAETKAEEEKLRDKAQTLEFSIEPRLLTAFKRIRKNSRNGLGVVYVQRDACGGCFNKIPPQRQLDIRTRKKVIVCEYCGRIMVDPELAGVKIEKPVEEAPKRRAARRLAVKGKEGAE